jgi:RNA polymerase sigma factor (sigma-70 family)
MKCVPLDDLLAKLCSGDAAAAGQVFREYEPYLRKVVRRLLPMKLRPKFDSLDVVQSTWGDLLEGFREADWKFTNVNQLRAFLVKATRNRFLDRVRQHGRVLAHEKACANHALEWFATGTQNASSQNDQAEDLWQHMLRLCPPEHRPILCLKRQGIPLAEIAKQTAMHPGSIRRILRNLAAQLAHESHARA